MSCFAYIFQGEHFFQLLFVPVGYYIMYGICTDLKEKMSYFFVTRSNINAYIAAKFVVGILYAFVMFELIFNIFCICGTNIFKIVDYSDYSCGSDVYEDVLKINPYLYFELRIFIVSADNESFCWSGNVCYSVFLQQVYWSFVRFFGIYYYC